MNGNEMSVMEPRLRVLVRRELLSLEQDPRSPERGSFHFVQSLIREVAYGTLARRDRRSRHLAAARYFETLGDDELAGALATHYVAAHAASEPGPEADAVAIQARLALSAAAERAATLGAHDQAVAHLRSAAAITTDAAEQVDLLLRAASSANAAARHEEARVLAADALELAGTVHDPSSAGRAQALLGEVLIDKGHIPEAQSVLEAAVGAFPASGSDEVRAGLLCNLSRVLMRNGEYARSITAADLALDIAERQDFERIVAESLNNKGSSLGYLGRRRESAALLRAAVDVARASGFVAAEIRALSNLSSTGEEGPRVGRESAREAERLALRVGNRSLANWAHESARVQSFTLADDWDAAIGDEGALGDSAGPAGVGSPLDEVRRLWITTLFLIAQGHTTDAILDRLEVLSMQVTDRFAQASVHGLRSDRALMVGDYAGAWQESMVAAEDDNLASFHLANAVRAALWGHDIERARAAADRLDAYPSSELSTAGDRLAARAGIAALEGRTTDAVSGYRYALGRQRQIGADLSVALTGLDFVMLMGAAHPAAREAAIESRAIFERVRATFYLDKLEQAVRVSAADAARGAPSELSAEPGQVGHADSRSRPEPPALLRSRCSSGRAHSSAAPGASPAGRRWPCVTRDPNRRRRADPRHGPGRALTGSRGLEPGRSVLPSSSQVPAAPVGRRNASRARRGRP